MMGVRRTSCVCMGLALLSLLLPTALRAQGKLPPETPPYGGGFDPRRIPIELQAWWTPNFGHIHAATLLPLGQSVSGRLNFDVRIVLHDNPSRLVELRIDTEESTLMRIPLSLSCPYDGKTSTNCAFSVPVSIDTTKLRSGWRELRIRATTDTPDGRRYLNSSGIPLHVENGGSSSDYDRWCNNTSLIGRGWYEGIGYTNSAIECVPLQPMQGKHTFRVRAQKDSKHLLVTMDKTHPIPAVGPWPAVDGRAGLVLFDKDGDFQKWVNIEVDTTSLADGWHSLAVQSTGPKGETSSCSYCKGETNFPAGVAKIWFYVQNGSSGGDTSAPTISGVGVSNITTSGGTVRWNTNEPSDSKVEYGVTPALGNHAMAGGMVTAHSVALSGLTSGTQFYYQVKSTDSGGNQASSGILTFQTVIPAPSGDSQLPVVSFVSGPISQLSRMLSLGLSAKDNVGVVKVELYIDNQKIGEYNPSAISALVLDVSQFPEGEHILTVKAYDAAGNVGIVTQAVQFAPCCNEP